MLFRVNKKVPDQKVKGTKSKHYIFSSFFCVFAYEILEVIIENLIISGISYLFLKIITTLFAVASIHTVRALIKVLITKIIHREGKDKMEKIKVFFSWIFANKKSLGSTIVSAVMAGAGITASWTISDLPQIMIGTFNIAPILFTLICVVCFVLNELGISGKGFEAISKYAARKEQESIEKEAQAQIKAEKAEKLAIEKAAKAQIEADEKAKIDAEKAAKIEAKKAELLKKIQ